MNYPYLKTTTKFSTTTHSVGCDLDTIIYDHTDDNNLVFVSISGVPIAIKKAMQDIRSYYGTVEIKDKRDLTKSIKLGKQSIANGLNPWKSLFSHDAIKVGNKIYSNGIMYNTSLTKQIIINWNNESVFELITEWLLKNHSLPITKELLAEIAEKHTIYTPVTVVSTSFPGLTAFKPDLEAITSALSEIQSPEGTKSQVDWSEINSVDQYIVRFLDSITEKLQPKIRTLLKKDQISPYIFDGKQKPFPGQVAPIQSSLEVLKNDRFLYLSAEQGCGKTVMTQYITHAYFKTRGISNPVIFILAPSTTLTQWKEEVELHFPQESNVYVIKSTIDFIKLHKQTNLVFDRPTFIISGKETFKLSYPERPSYIEKADHLVCPDCYKPLKTDGGYHLRKHDFYKSSGTPNKLKSNRYCNHCGCYLWSATYNKTKKTSLIDYIKRNKISFSLTICDEAQEGNNSNSIIGSATRTLLRKHTKKAILLSGTPNNGYSSSLYNMLFSLMPRALKNDNIHSLQDFVAKYGTLKAVVKNKDEDVKKFGRAEIKESDYREIEGINSTVFVKYLAQNFVYVELSDLSDSLPTLTETYVEIPTDSELECNTNSFFKDLEDVSPYKAALVKDSIVKHYLNNPFQWTAVPVSDRLGDVSYIEPVNMDENELSAKELKLVDLLLEQKARGRKVCVYVDFNHGGDYMKGTPLPVRLKNILEKEGIKSFILKSGDTVGRKAYIKKHAVHNDVLICNRKLVQVGLNLQEFPTYVNYMPSYRVNDVEQAGRRGWRINSTLENEIYHFYYDNKFEKEVIERYQTKKAESSAIQGRFNVTLQSDDLRTTSSFASSIVGQIKDVDNSDRDFTYEVENTTDVIPVIDVAAEPIQKSRKTKESIKVVDFQIVKMDDLCKKLKRKVAENQLTLDLFA